MLKAKINYRYIRQTPLPSAMMKRKRRVDQLIDSADKPGNYPLPADFDPQAYLALNPDVKAGGWDAASHWIQYGGGEGRKYTYSNTSTGTVKYNDPTTPTTSAIQKAAANVTPDKIEKGIKLLESGKGLLTATQQAFGKGATDASRLPKTKALKDAESVLMLPDASTGETPSQSLPFDTKWIWIVGGVIVVILILKFALRK